MTVVIDISDPKVSERFWSKVDKSGECWLWTSTRNRRGRYGHFTLKGRKYLAHRIAWFAAGNFIPAGKVLDHTCGEPTCVRVEHLRVITQGQNTQNVKGAYKNNATGTRGVTFRRGKYVAQAQLDKKRYYLGQYDTLDEADVIVRAWRREHMEYSVMDQEDGAVGSIERLSMKGAA